MVGAGTAGVSLPHTHHTPVSRGQQQVGPLVHANGVKHDPLGCVGIFWGTSHPWVSFGPSSEPNPRGLEGCSEVSVLSDFFMVPRQNAFGHPLALSRSVAMSQSSMY